MNKQVPILSGFSRVFGPLVLFLLAALSLPGQQAATLVRKVTPPSWQGTNVVWNRDVQPRNGIDDTIDNSTNKVFDIVVNFRSCPTASDVGVLQGMGSNQVPLTYLSSIAVSGVAKTNIMLLAGMTNVSFIEQQFGFATNLTVSVPSMCVNAGSVSCAGNVRALGYDGTGVNIAVIDTGVDINHAAFAATPQVGAYNAITKTFGFGGNNVFDGVGHGTHVASIALGQVTPNQGEGVAPHAGLIAVKVFDNNGQAPWADTVDGLQTVYNYSQSGAWQVNVINMSIGQVDQFGNPVITDGTDAFSQLVNLASDMGIVVVVSAGNNGPNNVGLATPAAATRAITVAASQTQNTTSRADDTIACFSSRGPRTATAIPLDDLKPEVAAPGVHTVNCATHTGIGILAARANSGVPDNGTVRLAGTSMASPHVAGLAALILQAKPGINPASVKQLIITTATAPNGMPQAGWQADSGYGYVNGYAAVSAVAATDLTFPNYPPPVSWESPDISIAPDPAIVGQNNTATVMIQNRGPNDAHNVRVEFGVYIYSASPPSFQNIGTVNVPLIQTGQTVPVSINWVPQAPGGIFHNCLQVEIGYGADTDFSNNHAARNITEQQSPVQFMVQNTATEVASTVQLIPSWGTNVGGSPNNWTYYLDTSYVTLAADDCPVPVNVQLFPGTSAQPGERQDLRVEALVNTAFGPIYLGGVTVTATKTNPVTGSTLPIYRVVQYGASPAQATALAQAMGLDTNVVLNTSLSNGVVSFIDPTNYVSVPTAAVTDQGAISNLLAYTPNPYPAIPIRFEQINFGAFSNLTVLGTNAALSSAAAALASANLVPQLGTPTVAHSTLTACYTNDTGGVVSNSAYLDTQVNYQFSVGAGYPLVGPGAQVQVAYGPTGNVTRLVYAAPVLTPGPSVQIIPSSVASNRLANLLDPTGLLRPVINPTLVYHVPWPWPWPPCLTCPPEGATNFVLPWYEATATVTVTNPADSTVSTLNLMPALIPATDDPNYVATAVLSASTIGSTQVVASVSVSGGQPPYTYSWHGSAPSVSSMTGPNILYTPVVRASPPPLSIAPGSGGFVTISWPDPSTGFVLESAPRLIGSTWTQVSGPVQTNSGMQSMTVNMNGNAAQFFRMRYVSQATTETVGVTVTDANGVSVQVNQNLTVVPKPVPPGGAVGDSWAIEDPWTPGIAAPLSAAFNAGMAPCFGPPAFWWKDGAAWVGDFIDPPIPHVLPPIPWVNGDDDFANWGIDTANLVLYIGHGAPNAITFTWPAPPMGPLSTLFYNNPKLVHSWGDDMPPFTTCQWLNLYSCSVMAPIWNGLNCPQRWGRAFDGLHIMTGFKTPAVVNPAFPFRYARNLCCNGGLGMPIRIAWRNAVLATGVGQPAEMGPIGPGGAMDLNDFYWGCGPVGPTIRWWQIRGWWYLDP
ncbi:MAG TPA: S8 family serine peptidase [Candidatus Acidoferrum sp.]|nr:S8 family serine peptidase [Candidatus Acidoferrum sp.]